MVWVAENNIWSRILSALGAPQAERGDRSAARHLYDANIGDPLRLNEAASGFQEGREAARSMQGPQTPAPLPDFTSGQVYEPNSAFDWQSEQAENVRHEILTGLATGGMQFWESLPPDMQDFALRVMQDPVTDAAVEGAEHFVGRTDVSTPRAAAEGAGVALQSLLASLPGRLRGEVPEPRSFSEIEGVNPTAALLSDLATGALGGLAEVGLTGRQAALRMPDAVRSVDDAAFHYARNMRLNQYRRRVRDLVEDLPEFQQLPPDVAEEFINQAATSGGNEHILLRYLVERDRNPERLEGGVYDRLVDTVRQAGLEPLPPDPYDPVRANRLFEGMSDDEAQQVFSRIADEGDMLEASLLNLLNNPVDDGTLRYLNTIISESEIDDLHRVFDPLRGSDTPQTNERLRAAFNEAAASREAVEESMGRRMTGQEFIDTMQTLGGLSDEEVREVERLFTGFGESDALRTLRQEQIEQGTDILQSAGLSGPTGVATNVPPARDASELRGFLSSTGEPTDDWLRNFAVAIEEAGLDRYYDEDTLRQLATRLENAESPGELLSAVDELVPNHSDQILRSAEDTRVRLESMRQANEFLDDELQRGINTFDRIAERLGAQRFASDRRYDTPYELAEAADVGELPAAMLEFMMNNPQGYSFDDVLDAVVRTVGDEDKAKRFVVDFLSDFGSPDDTFIDGSTIYTRRNQLAQELRNSGADSFDSDDVLRSAGIEPRGFPRGAVIRAGDLDIDDYQLITDSETIRRVLEEIEYPGDPTDYGSLFVYADPEFDGPMQVLGSERSVPGADDVLDTLYDYGRRNF